MQMSSSLRWWDLNCFMPDPFWCCLSEGLAKMQSDRTTECLEASARGCRRSPPRVGWLRRCAGGAAGLPHEPTDFLRLKVGLGCPMSPWTSPGCRQGVPRCPHEDLPLHQSKRNDPGILQWKLRAPQQASVKLWQPNH